MKLSKLLSALCLVLLVTTAQAENTDPAAAAPLPSAGIGVLPADSSVWPITANVTLAPQYVSRGFRQTWGQIALQGGLDYVHPNGFYVGTWLSNVSNRYIENGTVE